jgi:TolB protein
MTIRISALLLLATAGAVHAQAPAPVAQPFAARADEPRLANVRQLTFGGENAEAYFSADGRKLVFQATVPGGHPCDVIFTMNTDGSDVRRVSTGTGRTTCGYFFPGRDRIVYASTHARGDSCPPRPDYSQGYVWALYDYDIYTTDADGGDPRRLTDNAGYDAEATISPDGKTIIFTSTRDGDLELYAMDADGGNVRRLTSEVGYDGGAFFSPDGKRIVYRAHHPTEPEKVADYRRLLAQGLVRPSTLEIWVMDIDGRNKRQVTRNGAANFAPFFHPGGEKIIFSSNVHDPRGRDFDLYLVNVDGTGLERVTTFGEFDGFPMFSPDGKQLVFGSNRGARQRGETNVFIADWVER